MDKVDLKAISERIELLEKELAQYKAKEKAEAALKRAEEEAEAKAAAIVQAEKEEKELIEETYKKLLDEKIKEKRQQMKLEFPVTDRVGNLSKSDKALLDIVMGRKALNIPNTKAPITITTSNGGEWGMTQLAQEILRAKQDLVTVRNFVTVIDTPSNPYKMPLRTGRAHSFYVAENALVGQNESDFISAMTFNHAKLGSYIPITQEESEEAIVPVLNEIRQAIAEGLAAEEENAVIEGKWYGTSSTGTAITEFSGLLSVAGVTLTFGAIAQAQAYTGGLEFISKLRGQMGPYGMNPNQLALVVGPEVWAWMLDLPGVKTLSEYGNQATILTGELGRVYGIPVFVSTAPGLKQDNTGAGTENDAHKVILVNRGIPRLGDRRSLTIKTQENIKQDTIDIVGTQRIALATPGASDGNLRKGIAVATIYKELDS